MTTVAGAPSVVFVPGYGAGGIELALLQRRFARTGCRTIRLNYPARLLTIDDAAARLEGLFARLETRPIVVAHSFGGLVALQALQGAHGHIRGLLTLGTPHLGCDAAIRLLQRPAGRLLVGKGMVSALPRLPFDLPPGVPGVSLAGDLDPGSGRLLGLDEANDGLIRIRETRHPAMRQLTIRGVSHPGLIARSRVADVAWGLCEAWFR